MLFVTLIHALSKLIHKHTGRMSVMYYERVWNHVTFENEIVGTFT